MSRAKPASMSCDACRRPIAVGDHVTYGSIESGYRELCSRCFNEEVARNNGIDFQHVQFDPIAMTDVAGERHEFHIRVHLFGDRVSLESFELLTWRSVEGGSPSWALRQRPYLASYGATGWG